MKLLDRYIFGELFRLFVLCLFILMSILVLEKINFIANVTMGSAIGVQEVAMLIFYTSPAFLLVTIPLAVLLATLIVFSRMSVDSEIIAMRACGVSFYRVMAPVALLAVLAAVASLWLSVEVLHRGNYLFNSQVADYVSRRFTAALGERNFFDRFPDTVIYVNEKPAGGDLMKGVFIFDGSDKEHPRFITAREGMLMRAPADDIVFRLEGGMMYGGAENAWRTIQYGTYEMVMDAGVRRQAFTKGERELSVPELLVEADRSAASDAGRHRTMLVELHKRLSLPFACIVLALVAAPLGVQAQRTGGRGGIGLGIVLIIVNYLLLALGESLGRQGKLPPGLAIWLPNLLIGMVAAGLLHRASREAGPLAIQMWLQETGMRIAARFRGSGR